MTSFASEGRSCRNCGSPLITGFPNCSSCGATARTPVRVGYAAAAAVRKNQVDAKLNAARRRGKIAASLFWIFASAAIGYGSTYAYPILQLYRAASQSLIVEPMTLADDLHNDKVHAARKSLGFE